MLIESIQNRIDEIESSHKVEGGTHFEGVLCPTCIVIKKLQGLERQLLREKLRKPLKITNHTSVS